MNKVIRTFLVIAAMAIPVCAAWADSYSDTIGLFKHAGQSAKFFHDSYGYTVFPTIAKGGLGVGAAHGKGRVYARNKFVGTSSMTQLSVGLQAGGEAYSQIIFFEDQRSFDEFTSGHFSFDGTMGAVAITSSVSTSVGTSGTNAGASAGKKDADTAGEYHKGLVVFTIVKGGAMYEASVAGQRFSYKAQESQ